MNIQIFGARKSFDTRKAERWFKERRIKYQYIDLDTKGLSAGEYRSVRAAVGYDALVDRDSPIIGSWASTICCPRRRRRSCWRIPGCSGRPSSATADRPPWATAPTCGKPGNNAIIAHFRPPGQTRQGSGPDFVKMLDFARIFQPNSQTFLPIPLDVPGGTML